MALSWTFVSVAALRWKILAAIVMADVEPNLGADVARVLLRVPLAGRADQHESALVVMAVVVLEQCVLRIVVGIEALPVECRPRERGFVQLE